MNKKALMMMMNSRPNGEKKYEDKREEPKNSHREAAGAPYTVEDNWHHEEAPAGVFSAEMADKWTAGMVNTDGTTGAHWTRDQVKSLMDQHGIDSDLDEFWVVLNSVYSDYCGVAKKHNVNKMEFYLDMAKAWLYDADAVGENPGDKVWAYYDYVVKH